MLFARKILMTSILCAILFVGLTCVALAQSQWEPKEKITFVVHASPGTGIDIFMRTVADIWTKHKLVPVRVAVENVTGSGGQKARRFVSEKNKGNKHMLFGFTPSQINRPLLMKSGITPDNFTPIAMMAIEPLVMVVHADSEYKSVTDLLEKARKNPKKVLQGGGPYGNVPSMVAKAMSEEADVEFSYVPFKGGGAGVIALLGKHVDFILEQPSEVDQHVKAGKLRILASSVLMDRYPGVKTFKSQGYNFRIISQFRGAVAPPEIGSDVQAYYVDKMKKTTETPEWEKYVDKNEMVKEWVAGKDMGLFLNEEAENYKKFNKEMGLMK